MTPAPPPSPAAQAVEYILLRDARAVHDCAFFPLARLAAMAGTGWIVASVSPSESSGSGTIPGAYIDGNSGALVNPSGAAPAVRKEGKWQSVAAFDGKAHTGRYSWLEPMEIRRRATEEDLYSPFSYGGTIVFREGAGAGASQFEDVSVIFPEWSGPVKTALDFAREHPNLLQAGAWTAEETEAARRLLGDANELLSIAAFRGLLERRLIDAPLLRRTLDFAQGHRRAVMIYAAMVFWPERATPLVGDEIAAWLSQAKKEELEPAALAVYTAYVFEPRPPVVMRRARQVANAAKVRVESLAFTPDSDSRLALLLQKLQPPPEKQ